MMSHRRRRAAALTALGAVLALPGCSPGSAAGGARRAAGPSASAAPVPVPADVARLAARGVPTTAACQARQRRRCYQPAQLQRAYDLVPLYRRGLDGRGRTIVLVVPFGSATIRADLHAFDLAFGLPDPQLSILQPAGPVPAAARGNPLRVESALEASLDVEWSHAIAPGARIVLVETPTYESEGVAGFPDIVAAERYVVDRGIGDVISESFGATEQTFPTPAALLGLRSAEKAALARRVTIVAASGDQGAGDFTADLTHIYPYPTVIWPASDPLVTAVGGTQLQLDANGLRLGPDVVWQSPARLGAYSGPGGGLSTVFSRPAYQDQVRSVVGARRGIPDISMSAAYDGAVDVYSTAPGTPGGWVVSFGTSESAPLFAGVVAIADQAAGRRLGLLGPELYRLALEHAPGIVDITAGNNSISYTAPDGRRLAVQGYAAGPGYDLASGLGTVDAARLVTELAAGARRSG